MSARRTDAVRGVPRFAGAVAVLVAAAIMLALAGCTLGPTAADLKAECFANEALIQTEVKLFSADTGMDAPFQTVLDKVGKTCPSGGTYSYDPATGVVTCSVHGHP